MNTPYHSHSEDSLMSAKVVWVGVVFVSCFQKDKPKHEVQENSHAKTTDHGWLVAISVQKLSVNQPS